MGTGTVHVSCEGSNGDTYGGVLPHRRNCCVVTCSLRPRLRHHFLPLRRITSTHKRPFTAVQPLPSRLPIIAWRATGLSLCSQPQPQRCLRHAPRGVGTRRTNHGTDTAWRGCTSTSHPLPWRAHHKSHVRRTVTGVAVAWSRWQGRVGGATGRCCLRGRASLGCCQPCRPHGSTWCPRRP